MSVGFKVGMEVVVHIPEMTSKDTGEVIPSEEFTGFVLNPDIGCAISRLPGMEVIMDTGMITHIDPAWATPTGVVTTNEVMAALQQRFLAFCNGD